MHADTDPDEMIYDDVEFGEEGGCSSSPDNGWSSSEFESYDEASEGEGGPENGLPNAFMRGKPPQKKNHVRRTARPAPCLARSHDDVNICFLSFCIEVCAVCIDAESVLCS